jgi:lactate dehydrogenase-like 2-hydroxyacid dehydrogenase
MTAPPRPVVLVSHEMLARLSARLEPDYEVLRLWEHPDVAAFLAGPGQTVRALVSAGEVRLDKQLLAAMPKLGLIACVSAGYDGYDVPWCRAHGIEVTHSPGLNNEDVADHAVGAAIAAWRRIVAGDRIVREGLWEPTGVQRVSPSLGGRAVGVVGLGDIGAAIARRMAAFGTDVAWWGPNPKPDAPWPRAESLLALAERSNLLFVAARAHDGNHHLIDRAVIEAVGARGLICNVSRGSLVDQAALIAALKDGRLGYAALDVFETEPTSAELWRDVPNTVLTPHSAGATYETLPRMIALTLENLRRFFAGEPLATPAK